MALEDTINELVDAAGPALGEDDGSGSGGGCFSAVPPINPINQLILSVFGENYFPPYSTEFQPEKKEKLTNEKLLQMQTPGGGKIRPVATPIHNSIADYITPISGLLGGIFNFFAPLFIVLDVIRGLVDIICSFFDPVPMTATIVELFVTILPPAIALYPPLSSVLLALNTVKLILSIVAALISHLTPIIEKMVLNALSIPELLLEGNLGAIEGVTAKICTLITHLENEVGALAPIKFVIELMITFLNLGAKFFCVKGLSFGSEGEDSPCCTKETCPPVLINPPAGRALVVRDQDRFSMLDLINIGYETSYLITSVITDFVQLIIDTFISSIQDVYNSTVGELEPIIGQIGSTIESLMEPVNESIDASNEAIKAANALIPGTKNDAPLLDKVNFTAESFSAALLNFEIPGVEIPNPRNLTEALEALPLFAEALSLLGLVPADIAAIFDSIVFVQPQSEIKFLMDGGNNVVSLPNENGLLSEVGVGHNYSVEELLDLQKYIVDPEKIPASQVEDDPATLRLRMTKVSGSPEETVTKLGTTGIKTVGVGGVVTAPVTVPPKNFIGQYIVSDDPLSAIPFFGSDTYPGDQLVLNTDKFSEGDIIEFELEPDFYTLERLNLVSIGCNPDIQSAAQGFVALINADTDAAAATGGSGSDAPGAGAAEGFTGFDPLADKIGRDFPQPPLDSLQECLALQASDPSINRTECFTDILGNYIQDLTDFYDAVLCVGTSRIQSPFNVSKNYALADGKDTVTVTLGVRDAGGNNLLLGAIPTSTFRVEWTTTKGTFGPTIFDDETGEFRVTLTSDEVGTAEIFAYFIVNDKVCMRPGNFDGFVVTDRILEVDFIPEKGSYPRRRPQRTYVQSRGGRRR